MRPAFCPRQPDFSVSDLLAKPLKLREFTRKVAKRLMEDFRTQDATAVFRPADIVRT